MLDIDEYGEVFFELLYYWFLSEHVGVQYLEYGFFCFWWDLDG